MKKKNKSKLIIFALILLIGASAFAFARNFDKACIQYARHDVINALTAETHKIYAETAQKYAKELKNVITVQQKDGETAAIYVDAQTLNRITFEMTYSVTQMLENAKSSFSVPLGNATGIKLLSGKGPRIRLTVMTLGSVSAGMESELKSAGINQTLHRIYLRVNALVSVLTPFETHDAEICAEFVISEILVFGKVPELYYIRDATP